MFGRSGAGPVSGPGLTKIISYYIIGLLTRPTLDLDLLPDLDLAVPESDPELDLDLDLLADLELDLDSSLKKSILSLIMVKTFLCNLE